MTALLVTFGVDQSTAFAVTVAYRVITFTHRCSKVSSEHVGWGNTVTCRYPGQSWVIMSMATVAVSINIES